MKDLSAINRQIVLKSRPQGTPTPQNFAMVEGPMPQPGDAEVLIKHEWLGLAPAARVRMSEGPSYAQPTELGEVIFGQAVGTVVTSRHEGFVPGDLAMTMSGGWQEYSVAGGPILIKVDTHIAPASVWLGALGTSGLTAYIGLLEIARLRSADTVVVSAASGAVGSLAGQIAKIHGCRVVGVAGGDEKCRLAVEDYGFDDCVSYSAPDFPERLRAAVPRGIDVYYENVGGRVREAVWPLMTLGGRVAVCGLISEYNDPKQPGPEWSSLLARRLSVSGFIVADHLSRRTEFVRDMGRWYTEGRIRVREHVSHGLEETVTAFIGMLSGRNYGKTLVRL